MSNIGRNQRIAAAETELLGWHYSALVEDVVAGGQFYQTMCGRVAPMWSIQNTILDWGDLCPQCREIAQASRV